MKFPVRSLRHAPISLKVAMAPLFAIVCLLLIAALWTWANQSNIRALADIDQSKVPAMKLAVELDRRLSSLYEALGQSLVWEGAGAKADAIAALDKKITGELADVEGFIAQQRGNPVWSDKDKATFDQIAQAFGKFKTTMADTLDIKSTGLGAASGFITRSDSSYGELRRLLGDLVLQQQASTQAAVVAAAERAARNRIVTLIALGCAVVLSAAATWWCTRLIVRPLAQAMDMAAAVAAGDMRTPDVEVSKDETGQVLGALCQVTDSLSAAVREIKASADRIESVSDDVSQGNENLSQRTERTVVSLRETASSIKALTHAVRHGAGSATQADTLASEATRFAREGGEVVRDAVQTISAVSERSRRIGDIVGVIDGIAFQTNILALNAAVEAARAGESGRGFAVVAQEVRTLAQRSATAAREIRDLIADSVSRIEAGAGKVRAAGDSMQRIIESIQKVSGVVNEISTVTTAQANSIGQIDAAIGEMDEFTQQNRTLVEAAIASAGALKQQSERLMAAVAVFRTDDA